MWACAHFPQDGKGSVYSIGKDIDLDLNIEKNGKRVLKAGGRSMSMPDLSSSFGPFSFFAQQF